MDQKKIGAFIAQCRKEKGLTQMQLAERLEITNQAVSKWENGKGMPDVSLMQPLCDILGISFNELVSGEHISEAEYRGKAEENLSNLFKEKQIANLKPVKNLFSVCRNVCLIVTAIEAAVGIVWGFFDPEAIHVMLLNASVWLGLGLLSAGKLAYDRNRLKQLKQSGACVNAEIEDIIPSAWVRVGNYVTCKIACRYSYEGNSHRAMSQYYVLTPFRKREDLRVFVYVDRQNPGRCAVELYLG